MAEQKEHGMSLSEKEQQELLEKYDPEAGTRKLAGWAGISSCCSFSESDIPCSFCSAIYLHSLQLLQNIDFLNRHPCPRARGNIAPQLFIIPIIHGHFRGVSSANPKIGSFGICARPDLFAVSGDKESQGSRNPK